MSRRRTFTLPESALPAHWKTPDRPAPTYPEYAELRAAAEAAEQADGRFIDPVKLRRYAMLPRGWDWRVSVLGHDRAVRGADMHMLLIAHDRDLNPPLPEWLVDARAAAEAAEQEKQAARRRRDDADQAAWQAALDECMVEVRVLRNGHARPRNGYSHNLGHVVPAVDALSGTGRTRRRHRAGRALCESERRARPLDLSGGEGGPATCVNCLTYTPKIRPAAV